MSKHSAKDHSPTPVSAVESSSWEPSQLRKLGSVMVTLLALGIASYSAEIAKTVHPSDSSRTDRILKKIDHTLTGLDR